MSHDNHFFFFQREAFCVRPGHGVLLVPFMSLSRRDLFCEAPLREHGRRASPVVLKVWYPDQQHQHHLVFVGNAIGSHPRLTGSELWSRGTTIWFLIRLPDDSGEC